MTHSAKPKCIDISRGADLKPLLIIHQQIRFVNRGRERIFHIAWFCDSNSLSGPSGAMSSSAPGDSERDAKTRHKAKEPRTCLAAAGAAAAAFETAAIRRSWGLNAPRLLEKMQDAGKTFGELGRDEGSCGRMQGVAEGYRGLCWFSFSAASTSRLALWQCGCV